jgi:MYXO-CTERM domain-containing protein
VCANPHLSYFGGPILQSPVIIAVFWSSSINASIQANIGQFYADVTNSSYWSWLHEYDTVGLTPGTNQAILPGSFGGNFTIAPLKCAPGGSNCALTDQDLQDELTRQIGLGVLPAPSVDCTGNVNTLYMIELPPNVSLEGPDGSGNSCANNGFCAYHNTGTYGPSNLPLIYGALMDYFTGPCAFGCTTDATALGAATDIHSHELVEAVTDSDVGLDLQANYAAPAAWGDNDNNCGEIADICAGGDPGDTITVSGRTWVVQELWSNKQGKCTSTGPTTPICSGTTVTGCRKCSCGDDGLSCNGSVSVCETTSTNVLFGACEQCTSTNDTCTGGGGTCTQSADPSADDICSSCTPLTTCPAGDDCGTAPNGCGGTITCGTCSAPQTCGGGTPSNPNVCGCTPLTTCPAGDNCGTVPDGCGGAITCGTCATTEICGGGGKPNVCGVACTPKTCAQQAFNCGAAPDGCGDVLQCGTCVLPQTCGGGGTSNVCGIECTPVSCAQQGVNCGVASDGCGNVLDCGTCTAPQTCGGGGVPNVCGPDCVSVSCAQLGMNCGKTGDGCGNVLDCGTCTAPQTCGGGGVPNVCGSSCLPVTCAQQGIQCGLAGDGCGGTLSCGTCSAPLTCGGGGIFGQCGCEPMNACPPGSCGSILDSCGNLLDCGDCSLPQTCGGGGIPNQCGCLPSSFCPPGGCGMVNDGCGEITDCGDCPGGEVCSGGQCVSSSSSSSSSASSSGGGGSGSGGEAAASGDDLLWGRAGCATVPVTSNGPPYAVFGLAGILALGARRRRRS